MALSVVLSPLCPVRLICWTTSSASSLASVAAACGFRSVTVRSTTWEPPSPATLTWLVVKLFTFRLTWAFCKAVAAVVLPVAMPWIWLTRAWACALLAGTVFPETMRADAAYIGGCFATNSVIATRGASTHKSTNAQYCRNKRAAISSISTGPPRLPWPGWPARSYDKARKSPLGTNRSLT